VALGPSRLTPTPGAFTGANDAELAAYNRLFGGAGTRIQPSSLEEASLGGRLFNAALSGRSFIKELSGYDINNLPGYISTPIDILASPVGIASLAAAIPTGGTSLAAAGAGTIGRRLATRAALDVAGGIVGSKVGETAAEYTPGPDWLRAGVGLVTGAAAGGITGAAGGRALTRLGASTEALEASLPKGITSTADTFLWPEKVTSTLEKAGVNLTLPSTQRSFTFKDFNELAEDSEYLTKLPLAEKTSFISALNNALKRSDDYPKGPLEIIDPNAAEPIDRQLDNVMRSLRGRAVNIPFVRKILDSFTASTRNINELNNEVSLLVNRAIEDSGDALVYKKGVGRVVKLGDQEYLLQTVVANPSRFAANPDLYNEAVRITNAWRPVAEVLDDLKNQHNRISTPSQMMGIRSDVKEGGIFLPRGSALEDAMEMFANSPTYNKTIYRGGKPGSAFGAKFESMEEAIANGYAYPDAKDAIKDYVTSVGGAINGRVASRRLLRLIDNNGNFIMGTRENFIDNALKNEYMQAGYERTNIERDMTTSRNAARDASSRIAEQQTVLNDYTNLRQATFGQDIPVEYGKISRTASDGTPIKAQYDPTTGKIIVDMEKVIDSFDEKPWTKPYKLADGTTADPLPANQFSSPQEWLDFVEAHERAHGVMARQAEETMAQYENRINRLALDSLQPQQFDAVINDAQGRIAQLQQELDGHRLNAETLRNDLEEGDFAKRYNDIKTRYDQAISVVDRTPELRKIEGLSPLQERGEAVYAPRVIADEINSALNPSGPIASAMKLSKSFNEPLKIFHQLVDISDFGRLLPTMAAVHPFDSFKGIKAGINTMFKPTAVLDYLNDNDTKLIQNGVQGYGFKRRVQLGQSLGNPDLDLAIVNNIPNQKIKSAIERLSSITTNGITVARDNAITTEILDRAKAGLPINDDTVSEIIRGVSLTSGVPINRLSTPVDLMIQYPRWLQSQIEFIMNAAAGFVPGAKFEQQYARKALVNLVGTGLATTFAVNALQGRSTSIYNERGEFEIPSMRIGNTEINVFGPYGALVNGMYQALKPDGTIQPLLRSRVTPLIGLGWDLGTGSTYMNDVAAFDDPKYWAKFVAPYTLTNIASGDILGTETLLQGVGVRAKAVPAYQKLIETAEELFHKPYSDLTGKDKQQLKMANPKLAEELERITIERASQGNRQAQATLALQQATDELLKQQQQLGVMWKDGQISSTELRDQLENLMYATAARKQQIYKDYGLGKGGKEPTAITAGINGYFDLFNKADRGILAGGAKIGLPDWDVLDQLQAQYRSTLTPLQQQAIDDRYVQTAPGLDWYFKNKQIIQDSGFFDNRQKAVDELKSTIRQAIPGVNNYSDILEAYAKAERTGNRAQMMRINAIQNIISSRTQVYDNELLTKNPRLYKALVENGYRKQAQGRPLAANISE